MTLDKIIERDNLDELNLILSKKSEINFSQIKKYKYIEVEHYWYEDEDRPEHNTWIDVEGVGYGWLWCVNKIRSKFDFLQRRAIVKYAFEIIANLPDDTEVAIYENDDIMFYGFMVDETCYVQIAVGRYKNIFD